MMTKIKKEISMSQLAEMVARGFDGVDKGFDGVDKRFDGIELRLTRVESKLVEHDKRFSKLDYQIDEIQDILRRLEETDILGLQKRVMDLEKIVRVMSRKMELVK